MRLKKLLTISLAGALLIGGVVSANAAELDTAWYAAKNPDVVAELGNSPEALKLHYEMFGKKEGRAANDHDVEAQLRRLFKAEEYAALYPDVKAAFGEDEEALFQHYIGYGLLEARRPAEKVSQAAAVTLKTTVEKAMADAGIAAAPGSAQLVEIITGTIPADAGGAAVQAALVQAAPAVEKAVAAVVEETTNPAPAPASGGGSGSSSSSSAGGSGTETPVEPETPDNGLSASSTGTVANLTKGSGTATVETVDGVIKVAVTLTPDNDGKIEGEGEDGNTSARQNYHLTIPITGLTTDWALTSENGGEYGYDKDEHHEWNVDTDSLMLWLPVSGGTCNVVLKKTVDGTDVYQTVVVTTKQTSGLTASTATVDDTTVENGSGETTVTAEGEVIKVAVTLTSEAGKTIGGKPQEEAENGTQNYHLTIPITGLTTDWNLTSENGGQYTYDNGEHKDWNVANGSLKLWLPARDNKCTVVLKKGSVYQVVEVTTSVVETPASAPAEDED